MVDHRMELSERKAKTFLLTVYTSLLGAFCYGMYLIPIHAVGSHGHKPKHLWPIATTHFLFLILVVVGYVAILVGLISLLVFLHKEAGWD